MNKVDNTAVDLVHHDNRDFDVIPNYQPRCGLSFHEQTLLFDKQPGVGQPFLIRVLLLIYHRHAARLACHILEDLHHNLPGCERSGRHS